MIRKALVMSFALAVAALGASTAQADTTFQVTPNSVDTPPGTGSCLPTGCSLRAAVEAANTNDGPSTILVPAGVYNLQYGHLTIQTGKAITIKGDDAATTIVQIGGGAEVIQDRIFTIGDEQHQATNVAISGLTIQNGNPQNFDKALTPATTRKCLFGLGGGGIFDSGGTLALTQVRVLNNTAGGDGGGVEQNGGSLSVSQSTIGESKTNGNTACGSGGGIALNGGTLSVYQSTINGNKAGGDGGGIAVLSTDETQQPVTIDASTIAYNTATNGDGGGMSDSSRVTVGEDGPSSPLLVNVTITDNSAGAHGGAINQGSNPAVLLNDTITANTANAAQGTGEACRFDGNCGGNLSGCGECGAGGGFILANTIVVKGESLITPSQQPTIKPATALLGQPVNNCDPNSNFTSNGYNIDDSPQPGSPPDECGLLPTSPQNDQPGVTDAGLGPLADNGGPTQTKALLPGSPALDQIPASGQTDSCGLQPPAPSIGSLLRPADAAQTGPGSSLGAADSNGFQQLKSDQRGRRRPQPYPNGKCDIGAYEADTDMQVTSSPSPPTVVAGQQVTVTDTVTNNGNHDGDNVTLTDPGAGFTIVSATPSQGTCTHDATTVSCKLGTIKAGASATVTIVITTSSPGQISLTAQVGADEDDPNLANNAATTVITVTPQAARIVVQASPPCASLRHFPIHIQNVKQFGIYRAKVYLNGRLNRTLTGRALRAPVDLRNLPYGTFTVKITAWSTRKGVIRYQRVYHTCRLKPLPGHKHLLLGARAPGN